MEAAANLVLQAWGDRVLEARKALGLTQTAAADRLGIDQATLSRIENGQYRAMTPAMVLRLCLGLAMETEAFAWPRAIKDIAAMKAAS